MAETYAFFPDLRSEVQIPAKGILSRTLQNDDQLRVVLFGFAEGEELSAHTAPLTAMLHVLEGEARLTLGPDTMEVKAGAFARMPPNLPHGIVAKTPLLLLLVMLKGQPGAITR